MLCTRPNMFRSPGPGYGRLRAVPISLRQTSSLACCLASNHMEAQQLPFGQVALLPGGEGLFRVRIGRAAADLPREHGVASRERDSPTSIVGDPIVDGLSMHSHQAHIDSKKQRRLQCTHHENYRGHPEDDGTPPIAHHSRQSCSCKSCQP